ncbi:putative ribonuclease H-like domain-containing protein [Tanacetum coccineum]
MQAKPDNEDCNMKFLRALPPSWSQVAITLKTKGGLDYLSFDDLYNKLRTLEIDVKGGSSYDLRRLLCSYSLRLYYADTSSNVIESVLHSFVAESDPQQQITYEDFDQIGKLDLEELDIKWQMAMLSVRINRFEKKAGRKMKFNNRDAARYPAFKLKELDKSEEPKALLSVDSMLNWSDHEGEDEEKGAAQVYGMIAGDDDDAAGDASGDVSDAAAEFLLWVYLLRSKFGLGFGETFGSDEVFDPSAPSIFDTTPEDVEGKPLYDRFVKAVGMHVVPSPITGTFMPPSNKPNLDDTQVTYGSKSNNYFETNSVSNDFVSCDNSDKSSDSETTGFASCVSSVKSSSSKTNEHLASASSSVDFKTVQIFPHLLLEQNVPAGSRNPPCICFADQQAIIFNILEGLAVITNCTWMREDGGTAVKTSAGNKEKLDDFVEVIGGTSALFSQRNSKLPEEIVRWFLEFQEGPHLYSFNLINTTARDITCLLANASLMESTKCHRRMAHVNFKNINKLAKHGLVNGLPSKLFTNDHNCVACNKGKQHKASYKAITAVSTISEPLQLLHMDLFGPTSIRSIDHKYYSLVVTDDLSRCIIHEGGLALFKCYSWTVWPSFDDKEFILVGIEDLPIADIYLGMDNLGHPTEGKLTFLKNKFSPQWRFLVYTIQHCLSPKFGSWDQFGSPLAIALICLFDGRRFNWSSYIFKGMVNNISNAKRFLMYPRGTRALSACNASLLKLLIADEGTREAAPDVPQTF